MKISQEAITATHQIRDYGDGFLLLQLADGQTQRLTGNFLLGSETLQMQSPNIQNTLNVDDGRNFLADYNFDVLIVIVDEQINKNMAELMLSFRRAGIAAEIMSLGPACRTFNLLLAEGRKPLIWANL
ncbi:MTH938/NDUFAF3 family protein [Methylophaga sp. OBS3]|uniref:MTH938/NDUFAF3 family protein n=1 Tax=Methylophaga sp. OBS3 TaxID=2991934 RepID=UPI002253F8D8|nr:MTH938/NDUFAF3 family protein [Methylophaga sp. OBS3]MCX4190064.1 MTH938/NDUFAF3 family protein [Methylophaga sp. OBS3]